MKVSSRILLILAASMSAPALAQEGQTPAYNPVADAMAIIDSHKVSTRTGCSVPIPATWNASPWEQEAAFRRRRAFNDCLDRAMTREQNRLEDMSYQVDDIRYTYPNEDWSAVDGALDSKWAELENVQAKINTQDNWANTAVTILDAFTGPGAPYDSSPLNPTRNPMGLYGGYRPDSSVSAAGIR